MFNNSSSQFGGIPPVVKNLLIANIICFIGANFVFRYAYTIFPVYYFDSPMFHWWQPITYMFMHGNINAGGIMHILFNMFALYMFGPILERIMGSKRFVYFYLITGLGALALQFGVQAFEVFNITGSFSAKGVLDFNFETGMVSSKIDGIAKPSFDTLASIYFTPMVGASGAIFGLLVAFGYLFPNTELYLMFIPIPIKAKIFIPIYIILELFLGVSKFSGDSVAHFAHLGGALFGFILIKVWGIKRPGFWG